MNILKAINEVVVIVGIPILIGALIYIGKKLQIINELQTMTKEVEGDLAIIGDNTSKILSQSKK